MGTGSGASPEMQGLQHQGCGEAVDDSTMGRGLAGSCPATGQGQKSPQLSALNSVCSENQDCSASQLRAQLNRCLQGGNGHVLE